ncbi:MAG: PEP-CTERM sorting domain-containing protein [Pseudomonadota bacterium]
MIFVEKICLRGTVLAAVVLVASGVNAAVIEWVTPGTGDWFDAANWDAGRVPEPLGGGGAGDSASVNNDGTATADGASGGIRVRDIFVGANTPAAPKTGAVSGNLNTFNTDIEGQFGVNVGLASGSVSSANGSVAMAESELRAGQGVLVGAVSNVAAASEAVGELSISDGNLVAAASVVAGQIVVDTSSGAFSRDAEATGIVNVAGDVAGGVSVGVNRGGSSTSLASGELRVTGGDLELGFTGARIGSASGGIAVDDAGSAEGAVIVDTGQLRIGTPGSFVVLDVGTGSGADAFGRGTLRVGGGFDLGSSSFSNVNVGFAVAEGEAEGELTAAGGEIRVTDNFTVGGARSIPLANPARGAGVANGNVNLGSGDVVGVDGLAETFAVGYVNTSGLFGTGQGVAEGELVASGISGFDNYFIGTHLGTRHAAGSRADGHLVLGSGGIVGNASGDSVLTIGVSSGIPNNNQLFGPGGTAVGEVELNDGSIQGMRLIDVGASAGLFGLGSGMGTAIGSLMVNQGHVSTGSLRVGSVSLRADPTISNPDARPAATGSFTMNDGTLSFDSSFFQRFDVGTIIDNGSFSSPSLNNNPLTADGTVTLINVDVVGDAFARIGSAQFGTENRVMQADGHLRVEAGSVTLQSLAVGLSSGGDRIANGRVDLIETSLTVSDSVNVGLGGEVLGILNATNTDIDIGDGLFVSAFRSAIGTAEVGATRGIFTMVGGQLNVAGRVQVGAQFQGGEGELLLRDLEAAVEDSFRIGASSNIGTLFGNGDVQLEDSSLRVGTSAVVDSGSLTLNNSRMAVAQHFVTDQFNAVTGEYFDGASGDAQISLTRSILDVGTEFGLGVDDLLRISIDGTQRGVSYGAINAGTVSLRGGALSVDINFLLSAEQYVFDLIKTSALDAIVGDFASFVLNGFDSRYSFSNGVVTADFGSGLVDVYRLVLRRQPVPAPSAIALLLIGGLGLVLLRRRRGARA